MATATDSSVEEYLTEFIVTAGKITFKAGNRRWRMRQPTPEQAADGHSAYRLAYDKVKADMRLADLATDWSALEREARIRAAAAEAVYMLPLLLERQGGGQRWEPAFDLFDADSMAEFEALDGVVIAEMTRIYWGPIHDAIREAKKKSPGNSSAT